MPLRSTLTAAAPRPHTTNATARRGALGRSTFATLALALAGGAIGATGYGAPTAHRGSASSHIITTALAPAPVRAAVAPTARATIAAAAIGVATPTRQRAATASSRLDLAFAGGGSATSAGSRRGGAASAPAGRRRAASAADLLEAQFEKSNAADDDDGDERAAGEGGGVGLVGNGGSTAGKAPGVEDGVRWYLNKISGRRLLSASEEIELARDIQVLVAWEAVRDRLGAEQLAARAAASAAATGGGSAVLFGPRGGVLGIGGAAAAAAAAAARAEPAPQISDAEWAEALGLPLGPFRAQLRKCLRAKEQMVSANLRLVVSIAKKYMYAQHTLSMQDLIQVRGQRAPRARSRALTVEDVQMRMALASPRTHSQPHTHAHARTHRASHR
jgi:hypothetical protein